MRFSHRVDIDEPNPIAKAEAALKANEAATDADADAEQKADEKVEFADAEESAPEAV